MIKIGDSYFNETQIAAIQIGAMGMHADVYLIRGAVISVDVEKDDLQEILESAGLISYGPKVDPLDIPATESDELWAAYEDGYLFAAKDKNGQVYAYKEEPEKGASEWVYTGEEAGTKRLHGDFDFLSFEDEVPLSLHNLFSFRDGEDETDV